MPVFLVWRRLRRILNYLNKANWMIIPLYCLWTIKPIIDNKQLMNVPNIYPTFLEMAGLKAGTPTDLDGRSLAHFIINGEGKGYKEQYILSAVNPPNFNSGFLWLRATSYKLAYVK